jgi:Domain of unknown function (DUF4167)
MRGRNNRSKGPNPLTRSYESNGPDVKIRGTAQHVADKYAQLARDAQSNGDPVAAENYYQHAEHYYRIIAAAQEQFREQFGGYQRQADEEGEEDAPGYGGQAERPTLQQGDDDFGMQPQPFEMRPGGEGGERQDRFERGERQDRGERFQGRDRFGRGDRQDRGERFQGGRDRFPRSDRPRQDFQRPDYQRPEGGREDGRPESRQDSRQDRPRFEGRDRRREEAEEAGANGLPAFLTTPVRAPMPAEPKDGEGAPPAANGAAPHGEGNGRPRRRRRARYEGPEGNGDTSADFAPEGVDTPPAE